MTFTTEEETLLPVLVEAEMNTRVTMTRMITAMYDSIALLCLRVFAMTKKG